jgi:hypothetical protein
MSERVAEFMNWLDMSSDSRAKQIGHMFTQYNDQRSGWLNEKLELRNYIFATDTTTTSNATLPWRNKTTLPKLCQIRDNLYANYMQAILPNDEWLTWEAYTEDAAQYEKRKRIRAYMDNKFRESEASNVVSQLLLDYIDYGNCFAEVEYVERYKIYKDNNVIPGYIGPRLVRISPMDIVFDPTHEGPFTETPSITRKLIKLGDLVLLKEQNPDFKSMVTAIDNAIELRQKGGQFRVEDFRKASAYSVDGFGSYFEYLQSGTVELLEFRGTIYDESENKLYKDYRIIVVDRAFLISDGVLDSWFTGTGRLHCGWRRRPDNKWAMGPLDNLVGMQYRIDHLENLKADVFDLIAMPVIKIKGEVQDFDWAPMERIMITDEAGDVEMLVPDTQALNADTQIAILEQKMENFAGAPQQAMGIRTPGEKTRYEVQSLENAYGRIFQEKIVNFETNLLEPALNMMLESAARNLNLSDLVRVMDDDIGVMEFMSITREDITAKGKLRPIGARHFAAQAQMLQNINGTLGGPIGQYIQQHVSSKRLARLVEELIGIQRFGIVEDNVRLMEDAETAQMATTADEQIGVMANTPTEG